MSADDNVRIMDIRFCENVESQYDSNKYNCYANELRTVLFEKYIDALLQHHINEDLMILLDASLQLLSKEEVSRFKKGFNWLSESTHIWFNTVENPVDAAKYYSNSL
ncbi:uncharacterized protein ASCRUDRAFT_10607 [Ascoidea rubescens DSM 1968]|uniref:Uncharacterized protein n=1 Tax=Ascoidea rubescens DSM 1968 TaxID=1344418 RepID=A0A1D2V8N9_9ASCO|nr:hypothetical protein ASCRUDRAFT_10607 [Ascoidea rubescens DSM 1968]ODV58000.1 hypothetical protein ASCRUDRAFT_10607 [Ascoidea rubescens DSM 1968]